MIELSFKNFKASSILIVPLFKNVVNSRFFLYNFSTDPTGVLPQCDMKCDSEPCKNGGVCTEDFTNQESSCNCELTSYFGEYCMEEKGADFNGESILQRGFVLSGPILKVRNIIS